MVLGRSAETDPAAVAARDDTAPLVAVTGAEGFIGRYICTRWRDLGRPVRGLARTLPPMDTLQVDRFASGDLADIDAGRLTALLRGADAVVHLAGRAHVLRESAPDPEAAFHRAFIGVFWLITNAG